MNKKFNSNLYMTNKFLMKEFCPEDDPQGFLFSNGKYRTKILPEDLPEWYVYGYLYKQHGYISAKGVKHLLYTPNYFVENHLHKYDTLFISYEKEIKPYQTEWNSSWYEGYEYAIGGSLIKTFVDAAGKYSDYDVRDIQKEIERKQS